MAMSRTALRVKAIAMILLAVASILAHAQTPERLTFRSYTPQDYADILNARYLKHPVDLDGFLALPTATGQVPAVVIIPGSGGFQAWMQNLVARRLNEAGIATFIVDSFTARGVKETSTNQATVPMASSVTDGFAALQFLAAHPKIDPLRIGITGFSRGGTVALFTQERKFLQAMNLKELQFAAHLPFYPGCSTTILNPTPTSAPTLVLMGEKDDYTPATQCIPFIDRLRLAGAKASARIVAGAHHGWVSDAPGVTWLGRVQNYGVCNASIDDGGVIREKTSGATSEEGWASFATKVWKSCGKYGAHYGVTEPAREDSLKEMVRFFNESLAKRP